MVATKVTLISGFQNTGKTTLLRHLLENKIGLNVGILVNSMMEIDDALISNVGAKEQIVELQNGCACYVGAGELLRGIRKLMTLSQQRSAPWDHIVVDLSAAPRKVRDMFRNAVAEPTTLAGAELHTIVALVDASTFVEEFERRNQLHERPELGASLGDSSRQVVDMMCEQIECADILVLNKAELVSSQREIALVKQMVSSLNASAQLYSSENGQVELINVLGAATGGGVANLNERMEHQRTVDVVNAAHAHAGSAAPATHQHADGRPKPTFTQNTDSATPNVAQGAWVASFCYQRRVPFHPFRLKDVIRELPVRLDKLALSEAVNRDEQADRAHDGRSPMRCLLRSKGLMWLSNSHTQTFHWTHTGKHFEIKHYAAWWAAHPRSEWPTGERETTEIEHDFQGEMGDRRQELIFIGVNMDVAALTELLDDCLLTAAEMTDYRERIREESGTLADQARA